MKRPNEPNMDYSPEEAEKRLQIALRGARITGHKPMSDMKVGKNPVKQSKKRQKAPRGPGK